MGLLMCQVSYLHSTHSSTFNVRITMYPALHQLAPPKMSVFCHKYFSFDHNDEVKQFEQTNKQNLTYSHIITGP